MGKADSKKRYTVRDIMRAMEAWAPQGLAYSWDKVGLHTGSPDQAVSKVLTTLSISRDTVKVAKRQRADMIVAHHPLIWEPLSHLRSDTPKNRLYLDILEADIACYGAHTNLDIASGGVNHILAERLGLVNTSPLFPAPHTHLLKLTTFVPESHLRIVQDAMADAGGGVIGNYSHCAFHAPGTGTFMPNDKADPFSGAKNNLNFESELRLEMTVSPAVVGGVVAALHAAHPYDEIAYDLVQLQNADIRYGLGLKGEVDKPITLDDFAKHVRTSLEIDHVRVTGDSASKVKRIAVMGGAGGDSASKVPGDIDVFVTGDVKYHDALDAYDAGLNVIDAGHHGTEKWIAPALTKRLQESCPGLKLSTYMESDPFRVV